MLLSFLLIDCAVLFNGHDQGTHKMKECQVIFENKIINIRKIKLCQQLKGK
jgi:hypothetical protein